MLVRTTDVLEQLRKLPMRPTAVTHVLAVSIDTLISRTAEESDILDGLLGGH